jgi:hypothetical protein
MAELQFPNIVGQFQQGQQYGQQQRANKLAGLAIGSTGGDRQSALGQLGSVDPRLAMGLSSAFRQQDAAQVQAQQAAEVDHAKKINGAARFMLAAVQSGDPARIQGAYQSVRPYLAELGAPQGKVPPEQFDPSMLPHLYQIVGDSGGLPDQKPVILSNGAQLVDETGHVLADNPVEQRDTGELAVLRAMQQDPSLAATYRQLHPTASSDGVSTFRSLTPGELKAYGLPEGASAQIDTRTGKVAVLSKPKELSADKLADIAAKRQKAQQAQQDAVATFNDTIGKIDSLINGQDFGALGTFTGDLASKIPHTGAADAKAQLDTIGNQSVLNTLSALKSLSATGASGFGALSEKEGDILRNAAANLSTSQSNEALKRNLQDLRQKMVRARDRVAQQAIQLPEDSVGQPQPQQAAPVQSGGVDDLLSKYGVQ